MLKIYDCRTEHLTDPIGLDAQHPRFSWKLESDRQNVLQESYCISVRSGGEEIWNSGTVRSRESVCVRYEGPAFTSGQQAEWTVTVSDGTETAAGEPACFELGLLNRSDWQAEWIEPEDEIDYDEYKPAPCLRKLFTVKPGLVRARAYQSAHGLFRFLLNGTEGTDEKFMPGLTSYQMRIQYRTHDITALLHEGSNVWAVQLADGWWRGNTGGGNRNNYGFKLAFLGQLVLTYADGSTEVIGSDSSFRTGYAGLLSSDMKVGDLYDARREPEGWTLPEFDESGWKAVHPASEFASLDTLIPSRSVPVKEMEHFAAKVFRDPEGNLVLDFGQNIAGYVRMTLRNTAPGQEVVLFHGEGLNNGVFSTDNIDDGKPDIFQRVIYRCRGGAEETYCPWSAVFGFRYVKLTGYDEAEIQPGDFTAIAVYSALEETGSFSCSEPLINRLVSNSRWSQKGNFLDVATDCPTRERSAWTGDGQVYCKTASDFMDVYPFYEKWMADLTLEQFESGCVGNTFPSTNCLHNAVERQRMIDQQRFVFAPPTLAGPKGNGEMMDGSVGWGDCAVVIPLTMYTCYGDRTILERQYESAKRWSLYQRRSAKDHNPLYEAEPQYHTFTDGVPDADYIFDTKYHWGEWLEPDAVENAGPDSFNPPEIAKKGRPIIATAYLYYSSTLVARMAKLLGKEEDAADFSAYAEQVKRVYNKYFIQEDGTIEEGRQASYARTLHFGLAEERNLPKVAAKLAEAVEQCDFHLNTGFLSTPFLLQTLCSSGYPDYAFRLLEQTENPSWLHPITLGATTITENWGSLDNFYGSFNHYSYGAVCDFLFSCIAGIQVCEDAPGYSRFILRPNMGGSLTSAEAAFESPHGMIRSAWEKDGSQVIYRFTIPANTTAEICLPGKTPFEAGSGSYTFTCAL